MEGNVKSKCDNISLKVRFHPVWHRYNPETGYPETYTTQPNDAPALPSDVKVLIETTVSALVGFSDNASATATATNSFGDTATVSVAYQTITKKRLVSKPVSNGTIEVEVTGSATAEAEMGDQPNGQYGGAHAQGSISARAKIEKRSVVISNQAMEYGGNFQKGLGGLITPNLREPSGAMTVDSTVPWSAGYESPEINFSSYWSIETGLQAGATGFTTGYFDTTEVNWSSSGTGSVDNGIFNKWQTTLHNPYVFQEFNVPQPWPKGKTSTVNVKVQDNSIENDEGVENNYTIRWHAPFEDWQSVGATYPTLHYISANCPPVEEQSTGGSFQIEWSDEDASIAAEAWWQAIAIILGSGGDAGTAYFPHEAEQAGGLVSSLMGYLGILIDDTRPKPHSYSVTYSDLWERELSTPAKPQRTSAIFEEGKWNLVGVHAIIRYNVTPYKADQWGVNGYQGLTVAKSVGKKAPGVPVIVGDFEILP